MHGPEYHSECGYLARRINQFAIPFLLISCLAGNAINLFIYRLPYFKGTTSVHFLIAKAFANLIFVESRIFEVYKEVIFLIIYFILFFHFIFGEKWLIFRQK